MDDALKNPNQRRKKKSDGRSLEDDADSKIEMMRDAMTRAAQADTVARENGQPAMEKLKLLPQVTSLLNNNTMQSQLVDPEHNLLEAVRFFLEPLNDGSLPAYNIQKDLFAALGKLPINKDSLVASGIGKVVYFYTKSKRPEQNIKRQADRLMADWLRLVLKRSGDYKNRELANNNAYVHDTYLPQYLLKCCSLDPCQSALQPSMRSNKQHAIAPWRPPRCRTALVSKVVLGLIPLLPKALHILEAWVRDLWVTAVRLRSGSSRCGPKERVLDDKT